jgi:hypothetical protein
MPGKFEREGGDYTDTTVTVAWQAFQYPQATQPAQVPVSWKTYIVDGRVSFRIGNQSFRLDFHPDDDKGMTKPDHLEWMRSMLDHALCKLAAAPSTKEQSNG